MLQNYRLFSVGVSSGIMEIWLILNKVVFLQNKPDKWILHCFWTYP